MICASYNELSKELKNSIKIKVKRFLSYWSKNNILIVLICNLKSAWPTKISMPFKKSLNNFCNMHIFFQKVVYYSHVEYKTCYFLVGGAQYPHNIPTRSIATLTLV